MNRYAGWNKPFSADYTACRRMAVRAQTETDILRGLHGRKLRICAPLDRSSFRCRWVERHIEPRVFRITFNVAAPSPNDYPRRAVAVSRVEHTEPGTIVSFT